MQLVSGTKTPSPAPVVVFLGGCDAFPRAVILLCRRISVPHGFRSTDSIAVAIQIPPRVLSGRLSLVTRLALDDSEAILLGKSVEIREKLCHACGCSRTSIGNFRDNAALKRIGNNKVGFMSVAGLNEIFTGYALDEYYRA